MVRQKICWGRKNTSKRHCVYQHRDKHGRITKVTNIGVSTKRDAAVRAKAVCHKKGVGIPATFAEKVIKNV